MGMDKGTRLGTRTVSLMARLSSGAIGLLETSLIPVDLTRRALELRGNKRGGHTDRGAGGKG